MSGGEWNAIIYAFHSRHTSAQPYLQWAAFPTVQPVFAGTRTLCNSAPVTGKVAFLFSDFTTSARWQFDKQFFIKDMKKLDPGGPGMVYDAKAAQTSSRIRPSRI